MCTKHGRGFPLLSLSNTVQWFTQHLISESLWRMRVVIYKPCTICVKDLSVFRHWYRQGTCSLPQGCQGTTLLLCGRSSYQKCYFKTAFPITMKQRVISPGIVYLIMFIENLQYAKVLPIDRRGAGNVWWIHEREKEERKDLPTNARLDTVTDAIGTMGVTVPSLPHAYQSTHPTPAWHCLPEKPLALALLLCSCLAFYQ